MTAPAVAAAARGAVGLVPKFICRGKEIVKYAAPSAQTAKKAKGIGSKIVGGLGVAGGAFGVYELLALLADAVKGDEPTPQRESRSAGYQQTLMDMLEPSSGEDIQRSEFLRRLANQQEQTGFERPMEPSADLRALLQQQDMDELFRARQKVKPGLREAYARAGLMP